MFETIKKKKAEKKAFNAKVEKEADQIFMKTRAANYKEFPVINKNNINTEYAKDYDKVYKTIKKVRKAQRKTRLEKYL